MYDLLALAVVMILSSWFAASTILAGIAERMIHG